MDTARTTSTLVSGARLRRRPDLVVVPQWHGAQRWWAIKDPVASRFFLLREEEFAILEMLDGKKSVEQLGAEFAKRFVPRKLSAARCQAFLAELHQNGLVISSGHGQGRLLRQREGTQRARQRIAWLTNLWGVRWRGFNPDSLLEWLYPKLRWVYTPSCSLACGVLVTSAMLLLTLRFQTLRDRWPDFYELFTLQNACWLLVVLVMIKIMHELAHGLTCKHFGGECNEMGILWVAGLPSLYCDVSDSWLLASRWQRIAVAAAGMGFELVLAALATFGWWWTGPGPFNATCRNVMLVCGIRTLLINGNPLMRFDGYFILSDLLGTPNLHARARSFVRHAIMRWGLGVHALDERVPSDRQRGWLAAFAICSSLYRWSVLLTLLWLVNEFLVHHRWGFVMPLILALTIAGLVEPAHRLATSLQGLARERQLRGTNVIASGCLLLLLATACCLLPIPWSVRVPAVLQARGTQIVYATAPGHLVSAVPPGTGVVEGEPLVVLKNHEVALLVRRAEAEYNTQRLRVDNLKAQCVLDTSAKRELPTATDRLTDFARRLETVQREEQRLILRAPRTGRVLPMPAPMAPSTTRSGSRFWRGTLLEPKNHNGFVDLQTPICMIGDDVREAVLTIDQNSISQVRVGQQVSLYLGSHVAVRGVIRELAQRGRKVNSRDVLRSREGVHRIGLNAPFEVFYEARVSLEEDPQLPVGTRARARIHVARRTLREIVTMYLVRTFAPAS